MLSNTFWIFGIFKMLSKTFGIFWKTKKEFFEILDKILDDDNYRRELELKAIERANELSTNEDKMIKELHTKLVN